MENNIDVIRHYDALIDEGNDPVHDPAPLREYMDKWDGDRFIACLNPGKGRSALEIGVGSGRLAVRVGPLFGEFWGIDISPKTIIRARENLGGMGNVTLVCGDFMEYDFRRRFDVVYSSLTFMHIEDKERAVVRVAGLLNPGGVFVLSVDKSTDEFIEYGERKIKIYPAGREAMAGYIKGAGLCIECEYETEFAFVFAAMKV